MQSAYIKMIAFSINDNIKKIFEEKQKGEYNLI